jgi:hypothetical protein
MKINGLAKWIIVLMLLVTVTGVQAQTNSKSQVEQSFDEFRAWMQKKSGQADSTIRNEWPSIKQEYKEFTYSLDQNTRSMTESSRNEYAGMKQRYKEWEERNETRKAVDLDGRELERWERNMTGTTHIGRIKPANLRDAFVKAIAYTREERRNWTLRDWDYAEFAFGELNTRKTELLDKLNNSDKIKIAALQVEFAALKKSREAKDMYQDMRVEKR